MIATVGNILRISAGVPSDGRSLDISVATTVRTLGQCPVADNEEEVRSHTGVEDCRTRRSHVANLAGVAQRRPPNCLRGCRRIR